MYVYLQVYAKRKTNEQFTENEIVGRSNYERIGFQRVGSVGIYDSGSFVALILGVFMDVGQEKGQK